MPKKNPKRVGATIERAAVIRKIERLKQKHYAVDPGDMPNDMCFFRFYSELEAFLRSRVKRIRKRKGGL